MAKTFFSPPFDRRYANVLYPTVAALRRFISCGLILKCLLDAQESDELTCLDNEAAVTHYAFTRRNRLDMLHK